MEEEKAYSIIEKLANGRDPITGECFPESSTYNHPEIIRALFFVLRNKPKPKKTPKQQEEKHQEKQQENIAKGLPMNYGLPWTEECIEFVIQQYTSGVHFEKIAHEVARKPSSIVGLLKKKDIITEEQALSMASQYQTKRPSS